MMKAAAPMIGGISWPLVEAATSTEAALCGGKPRRFIRGMVKVPVVTVLAMEEPEMIPIIPEAATEALAGPPSYLPSSA